MVGSQQSLKLEEAQDDLKTDDGHTDDNDSQEL